MNRTVFRVGLMSGNWKKKLSTLAIREAIYASLEHEWVEEYRVKFTEPGEDDLFAFEVTCLQEPHGPGWERLKDAIYMSLLTFEPEYETMIDVEENEFTTIE